jgi:hypothetical protein
LLRTSIAAVEQFDDLVDSRRGRTDTPEDRLPRGGIVPFLLAIELHIPPTDLNAPFDTPIVTVGQRRLHIDVIPRSSSVGLNAAQH